METIIEFLIELLFNSADEVSRSKKMSKKVKYPLVIFIIICVLAVVMLIGFIAFVLITSSKPHTTVAGIVVIIFDIAFSVFIVLPFIKTLFNNIGNA